MAKVLVPLAEGFEEIEAITVIDLLRRAAVDVTTASQQTSPVTGSHGIAVMADRTLDDVVDETFDLMVLPGGLPGADHLNADPRIHRLLERLDNAGKHIAAICAAPKVLVTHGMMRGHRLTAYPGALSALALQDVTLTGQPVEVDGRYITGRGPGTAMDFALQLIETLQGKGIRDQVEQALQRS